MPSVMIKIGPSAGKSEAFSRQSIPGCRTVPPRPVTMTHPAIASGARYPASVALASQKNQ